MNFAIGIRTFYCSGSQTQGRRAPFNVLKQLLHPIVLFAFFGLFRNIIWTLVSHKCSNVRCARYL